MNIQLPLYKTLRNGMSAKLDRMQLADREWVRELLNIVIIEGQTYPQIQPLSESEFAAYWTTHDAFVVRGVSDLEGQDLGGQELPNILGAFYLKPNFLGRCSHLCNAGFIVESSLRGQGIGRWMGESMLAIATAQGYEAVIFNLVFATNTPSISLWQSLGFSTIGRIPEAVQLSDGSQSDALILYRSLR
ncbi:GNAT family N-acetyltransferase [Trichocoleus sp. FACHB-591]|uniref:GNAT family N-acetyltransferase n=1 Tax=Trichocoleus sp. FACHB-591 TaxID=2692872 RepID=UPI0018EFA384|nr:N-acetyltransferase [Trichocoleus sp. FACHB-591]